MILPARHRLLGAALTGAAALATAATVALTPAAAQTPTPTRPAPTATPAGTAPRPSPTATPAGAAPRAAESFLNHLAARLGISADRLREAIIAAAKDAVQRRAAEGKLTPEQARRLIERIEQHGMALLPRLLAPQRHERHERHDARTEVKGLALSQVVRVVASATGLSPRQVLAELRAGKTLAQIGQEHGKSQADLKAALLAALKQRLDEAVSSGRITAEQARRLLDQASQRIDGLLTRSFPRRGP